MKSWILLGSAALVAVAVAQLTVSQVTGDWEGDSKCVNLNAMPGCKDEHVVYHIIPIHRNSNQVLINADRVVDKKPISMGEILFTIDGKGSAINNEMMINGSKHYWNFVIKGDKMTGTLKNKDKVVLRQITLKAQKKA